MKILIFVLLASVLLTPVTTADCNPPLPGCLSCEEGKPTSCNRCEAGNRLTITNGQGLCSLCPYGKGRAADRFDRNRNTFCTVACLPGCRACGAFPDQCFACMEGYKYNFAGKYCQACPPKTGRAADEAIMGADTQCTTTCDPKCRFCAELPDKCVGCDQGYVLNYAQRKCVPATPMPGPTLTYMGKGPDQTPLYYDGIPEFPCDPVGALFCGIYPDHHMACLAGFSYSISFKLCSQCPPGFTRAADTDKRTTSSTCDVKCFAGCNYCEGTANYCYQCNAGYRFSAADHKCVVCPAGTASSTQTTISPEDTYCTSYCSDPNCYACDATGGKCLGCRAGYKFDYLTKKCTACEAGTGRGDDKYVLPLADTTCTACHPNCLICGNDAADCLACKADFRLDYATKTCVACEAGFTKTADSEPQIRNTYCMSKCLPGCASCAENNPNQCLRCAAGYRTEFINGDRFCRACTGGQGVAEESVGNVASTACSVECEIGCENCSANPAFCVSCTAGYFMSNDGVCVICPKGLGKPRDHYPTFANPSTNSGYQECSVKCHESCNVCRGPSQNECLNCAAHFYFNGVNACTKCSDIQTKNADEFTFKLAGNQAECSLSCDSGSDCKACRGNGVGQCSQCKKGYYTLGIGSCDLCPDGRGKLEDTTDQTAMSTVNQQCNFECSNPGCKFCVGNGPNDCQSCLGGYKFVSGGTCEICTGRTGISRIGSLSTGPTTCDATCNPACESCSKSNDDNACLMCSAGHYLSAPGSCRPCPDGHGKAKHTEATKVVEDPNLVCLPICDVSCKLCTDVPTECVSCNAGYYWSAVGTCTKCGSGTGRQASASAFPPAPLQTQASCQTCENGCDWCRSSNAFTCFRCKAGFFMNNSNGCSECPEGTGKDVDTETKVGNNYGGASQCNIPTCATGCKVCKGTGATDCLMCKAGYFLGSTGCTACDAGSGKPADTSVITSPTTSAAACSAVTCSVGCDLCASASPTTCIRCSKGFYLSAVGTCSQCPAGTGKYGDTSDPTPFAVATDACTNPCPNCLICDGSPFPECLKCDKGFYYSAADTCTACPTGSGKPADTALKTSREANTVCNKQCHEACTLCFGTEPTECLKCNAGYFKSAATTCSMCPSGRGKDVDPSVTPAFPGFDGNLECDITCEPTAKCLTCKTNASDGCLNCPDAHYFSSTKACVRCENKKTKAADTQIITTTTTQDAACTTPCDRSCRACSSSTTFCLLCAQNYYWTAPGVCTMCSDGRGRSFETNTYLSPHTDALQCGDCHASCLGCNAVGPFECSRCRRGEFLSNSGECKICPAGWGKIADPYDVPVSSNNGGTECNIPCHENCQNCFGPGANQCTTCKGGFYFSGAGTCSSCPPNTGKAADTETQTAAADPNTVCTACNASCLSCFGPEQNKCIKCSGGYSYASAGQCNRCPPGLGKAKDEVIPENTSNHEDACTIPCHGSCNFCKGPAANDCISCRQGYWWAGNGVCTQCDDFRGKAFDGTPLANPANKAVCIFNCDPACLVCGGENSPDVCPKCNAGFYQSAFNGCTRCPPGKGKPADADFPLISETNGEAECTLSCHSSCANCKDETARGCLSCNAGFFMSQLGTCTLCAKGTGQPADTAPILSPEETSTCTGCDPSCAHCSGSNSDECLSCNDSFYLSNPGVCSYCPAGFGRPADLTIATLRALNSDGSVECASQCHASCKMCKGPTANDCLNCNDGYFWAGSGVCSACPAGFGKVHDGTTLKTTPEIGTNVCDLGCDPSCKSCTAANDATACLNCNGGYFKMSEGVCSRCKNKGKLPDPVGKSPLTNAVAACTLTCAPQCKVCSGPTATDCLACADGHYLSAAGTCTMCPFGSGKPFDTDLPQITGPNDVSTTCDVTCHRTCSSCSTTGSDTCVGCSQRFFWVDGNCLACPLSTSRPANDAAAIISAQSGSDCTLKCHPSCQHCSGPSATDCLSCSAGYYLSGEGVCTSCPNGKGKAVDEELFPTQSATEEACNIFCDSCSSGCQTCSGNPFECVSCVSDRFLSSDKTCGACPDYCLSCSEKDKCDKCPKNFKLTTDGKGCIGDCTVENCALCAEDPAKCTKCNDEFVLKSATECIKDVGVVVNELSSVNVIDSPQLNMDIRSDKLELAFSPNESRNFTSVTVQDKLNGKVYTCAEVSCTYSIKNDKLSMDFNADFTIVQGKLTIERGAKKTSIRPAWISSHKNRRTMQSQADYPIVVDGISLMKKSPLNPHQTGCESDDNYAYC